MLFNPSLYAIYDFKEPFDIELFFNIKGKNLFDLAYFLVDLNSVINTFHYLVVEKKRFKKPPTTSRVFTRKFQNAVCVKSFKNGSFLANVGAGVLTGIILKFVEKVLDPDKANKETRSITVNITNNFINGRLSGLVSDIATTDDIEKNTEKLLSFIKRELERNKIVVNYDQNAVKLLAGEIKRLGQHFDRIA